MSSIRSVGIPTLVLELIFDINSVFGWYVLPAAET